MAQAVFFRKIKSDRKEATSTTQLAFRIRKEGKKKERRKERGGQRKEQRRKKTKVRGQRS